MLLKIATRLLWQMDLYDAFLLMGNLNVSVWVMKPLFMDLNNTFSLKLLYEFD